MKKTKMFLKGPIDIKAWVKEEIKRTVWRLGAGWLNIEALEKKKIGKDGVCGWGGYARLSVPAETLECCPCQFEGGLI